MATKKAWDLEKSLLTMRQWVTSTQTAASQRDGQLERILHEVDSTGPLRGMLANSLGSYAQWEGAISALEILDGDARGWRRLQRSFLLGAWSIRVSFGLLDLGVYDEAGWLPVSFNQIALVLAHAMGTGEDSFTEWCGARILEQLRVRKSMLDGWADQPFGPFVLKLFCAWKGLEFDLSKYKTKGLGVYEGVFKHWDDEARLAESILALCDYHVRDSSVYSSGFPQFDRYPYNVLPVEVLALRRVRRDLGLSTPEPSHPLLELPLAHPPEPEGEFQDELIAKVRFKALLELPRIGDPW